MRSLHARLLYSHNEDRANLAEAWAMQDTRREGRELPRSVQTPELLQYREIAMFGRQISRLFDAFPREQVRVVLLEEWRDDPRGTYLSLLEFLGLDDDGRTTFPKVNEQRRHRLDLLGALDRGLGHYQVEEFYYLSRALLVKDERHIDRFDRVFGHVFRGLEPPDFEEENAEIPEEWLRKEFERLLSDEEKAQIQSLGGLDKLIEEFKKG